MQLKTLFLMLIGCFFFLPSLATAEQVSVDLVADNGRLFPTYPTRSNGNSYRAYVEAKKNTQYGIRISNHSNQRVGVIVAVDGRNIISGKKSYLDSSEQMYLLNPYEERTYRGWRSSRNEINRFYFTSEGDSYAGAWDDYSAMGVIAIAVFPEKMHRPRYDKNRQYSAPGPSARQKSYSMESQDAAPGTGFGQEEFSASERVYDFRPKSRPVEKHFLKYEWRETLCRKHIIACDRSPSSRDRNRFWDDDEQYAPSPPRRNNEYWRR